MGIEYRVPAQRIVAISCVKNENDIIEAFVRHTLTFVDKLVVLDNGSTDGSLEILRALREHGGLPVDIVEDPSPGHWQWQRMTRLMNEFAVGKYGADWVVSLDADEFIDAESPFDFRSALSSISGPVSMEWRTYVPSIEDDEGELNPVLRMRHRLAKEELKWFKVIVPRSIAAREGAQLAQGNHEVLMEGRALAMTPIARVNLAHFPIRDPQQFPSKIALCVLQHTAMHEKDPGWGYHLFQYWQTLKEDPQKIADTYRDAAMRYGAPPGIAVEMKPLVLDPIAYHGGSLTATVRAKTSNRLLGTVLNYAERLASSYATLQIDHANLVSSNATLQMDHESLVSSNAASQRDYDSLVSSNATLQMDHKSMVASKAYRLSLIIRAIWHRVRRIAERLQFWRP
jgi:hypothetical protein